MNRSATICIDRGISQKSIEEMLCCFKPQFRSYKSGENIMLYSDKIEKIGVMIEGEACLYSNNEDGEYGLMEKYEKNDVFGELFCLPLETFDYVVEASSDCRVMFIDYRHIITPCDKTCEHHTQLINNLFCMAAQKARTMALHINILSQHTTRKKLWTYLKYIEEISESKPFVIPMSLVSLAEYLSVDRSAMMREIRLMKEEGLLQSAGRKFLLAGGDQL